MEVLLPLLLTNRFLSATVTSTVKCCRVLWKKIDVFFKSLVKHDRLQITAVREMHASERCYFCCGKPLFKNPIQQKNAIRKASRCDPLKTSLMLELGCFDAGLARNCRMFSKKLIDEELMRRIQSEQQ